MRYNVTIEEEPVRDLAVDTFPRRTAHITDGKLYQDSVFGFSGSGTDLPLLPNAFFRTDNGDFGLINGDCTIELDVLPKTFDMVFADPPYFLSGGGISCQSGKVVCVDKGEWDKPMSMEELDAFNFKWLKAVRERMKENATIWISGTHHNIFSVQQQLLKLGFKILNVVTWAKTNPPPNISCRFFTYSTEFVIWARKSAKVPHVFNYELMKQMNGGKQMRDVWQLPAIAKWEKACGKHPTQKPIPLLLRIVLASTNEGDWILDPFAGSSTTGIAANLVGRNFVGIEKEAEYAELSKRRRLELEEKRAEFLKKVSMQIEK